MLLPVVIMLKVALLLRYCYRLDTQLVDVVDKGLVEVDTLAAAAAAAAAVDDDDEQEQERKDVDVYQQLLLIVAGIG